MRDDGLDDTGGRRPPHDSAGLGRGARRPRTRWGPAGSGASARRHPWRSAVTVVGAAVVGVVAWAVLWYQGEVDPGAQGASTVVTVDAGSSVSTVIARLVGAHVVGSGTAFRLYLLLHGTPTILPGGYLLYGHEAFANVRAELAKGPDVYAVTLPPGFTVAETATRVGEVPGHHADAFAAVARSGTVRSPYQPAGSTNLDGLLGTGTYVVLPGETDAQLLQQMVGRFDTVAGAVNLGAGAAALGMSPYQVVTAASIVEKEGVYSENLGKVARVIYNRLAKGVPLQMDSTVLYSEGRDGGPVTAGDLTLNTPYNTYLHKGLTPTPICLPSKASLEAALDPPAGDWLYFVLVSKDGTEAFSDTLAGQLANEKLAQSRGLP